MSDDWRNGRHVVYRLHAHIVLTPKSRKKVMTDRVAAELTAAFVEVCTRFETTLDAFEADQDHAHLLVTYPPKVSLSRLVSSLKTISSYRVRQQNWPEVRRALWAEHFWSPSYAVTSCDGPRSRRSGPTSRISRHRTDQPTDPDKVSRDESRSLDPAPPDGGCAPVRSSLDLGEIRRAHDRENASSRGPRAPHRLGSGARSAVLAIGDPVQMDRGTGSRRYGR